MPKSDSAIGLEEDDRDENYSSEVKFFLSVLN
jgi:hypothetical protein